MAKLQEKTKKEQAPAKNNESGRPRASAAIREPRMTEAVHQAPVKSGRSPRGDLTVRRESMSAVPTRGKEENIVRTRGGVDRVMLSLILILLALGSIMVFSASYPSALAEEGDSMYYIKRQLLFSVIGIAAMLFASIVPLSWYKKLTPAFFLFATFLLIIVLIPGIGISNGEARRWLGLKAIGFTFQPSELMKVALVMMLAWYLDTFREKVLDRSEWKKTFLWSALIPCAFVGAACILVLLEKHLSGTIIMGLIGLSVMVVGSVHPGWMAAIVGVGGSTAVGLFLAMNPYALKRILTFTDENADKLDEAWQTTQGLLAIGSGGFLGVGLGGSRQKYSYVSEAQNDFIFTIWCEEMGFVGAVALILLFLFFIWRGYVIAMRAPDIFSCLVVMGIICQVGIQAFLNIAVVTDVVPNTGVALPFFSYGGTSLIILLAEMGIVLAISKHSYQKK